MTLVEPAKRRLLALEFDCGEAVPRHALDLRKDRVEGAHVSVRSDDGAELHGVSPARKVGHARQCVRKRWIGLVPELGQPLVEHPRIERTHPGAAEIGHRAARALSLLVQDLNLGRRELGIGRDRNQRRVVDRNLRPGSGAWIGGAPEAAESSADHRLDRLSIKIADRDDRHQIRPVPVLVEAAQPVGGRVRQDVGVPDRESFRVARTVEDDRELLILDPRRAPPPSAPLLDHDTALLVDLLRVEDDATGPVHQDLEGRREHLGVVHRDLQHVHRFVEAGVGVDVGSKPHPDRLEVVHQLQLLEVLGAVEGHVLDEVGKPELVVVLEDRAGVDDQAQLGAVFWLVVFVDEVGEAVRQGAGGNLGIGGDRVGRVVLLGPRASGVHPARGQEANERDGRNGNVLHRSSSSSAARACRAGS